jgi:hypothetical protein
MATRAVYTFREEPRDRLYRQLISVAGESCSRALLVIRDSVGLSTTGKHTIELLAPYLSQTNRRSSWPGTQLLAGEATVYEFALSADASALIERTVSRLFEWQQPDQPEDLCLLRQDGSAWLASIAHEHDAFMVLSPDEARQLAALAPDLWSLLQPEPHEPEDLPGPLDSDRG